MTASGEALEPVRSINMRPIYIGMAVGLCVFGAAYLWDHLNTDVASEGGSEGGPQAEPGKPLEEMSLTELLQKLKEARAAEAAAAADLEEARAQEDRENQNGSWPAQADAARRMREAREAEKAILEELGRRGGNPASFK